MRWDRCLQAAKTEDPLRPLSRMGRSRGEKFRLRDLLGEPINRLNLPVEELGVQPDQRAAKYLPKNRAN
jgi:hypothetical protein